MTFKEQAEEAAKQRTMDMIQRFRDVGININDGNGKCKTVYEIFQELAIKLKEL